MSKLREIVDETKYVYGAYWRSSKKLWDRVQSNRRLLPSHDKYKKQLRIEMGIGLTVLGLSVGGLTASLYDLVNTELQSQLRAVKMCEAISCRENLITQDIENGIDPNTDFRVQNAVSYKDIKALLDKNNHRDRETLLDAMGATASLPGLIASTFYIGNVTSSHRRRIMELKQNRPSGVD